MQVDLEARANHSRVGHRRVAEGSLADAAEEGNRPAGGTVHSLAGAGSPAEEGIAGAAGAGSRQRANRIHVWHRDHRHHASRHGDCHAILWRK